MKRLILPLSRPRPTKTLDSQDSMIISLTPSITLERQMMLTLEICERWKN
jgi:hypothetical protein